ncbi:hypothetical protein K2173_011670 [Erythroxylum novogranatense]|uniref:ADP-ribosyl cyclase/cyclic ADP-ribose hydrolase n=1 Tax=Erythroxylum novogranatense TaxID=1862640 RepID=A0AAV8T121_9ROSI|nr:hypothetical protein K2173_011670 [Erythroxylum novogranatense]
MAFSFSSSSLASQPLKYDVFLNFRGEDTRRNFTSHLYAALCRKDIITFFDDEELKRGEEIALSLPQAIQDSTVAVTVFSKNYASSTWCLDELAKVIECHQSHGQIVVPIFYDVDPSHLRKQSHDVAAAFVKHKQNPMNAHKIPMWRDALTTAANLSGFNSKEFRNDDLLINKIVEDILEKLNQSMPFDDFEHLVGMDSRVKEIKEIFTINPLQIRILGIWGMGGVGKTTIAEVIYKMMSHQFQGCSFVYNVRQQAKASGIKKLQEELVSKALGENTSNASLGSFSFKRLGRKKMLIVLDDINDPLQLDFLIGDPCWFGLGSMILVISRDKQVFAGRADFLYEVRPLNNVEALHLFSKSAFKQKYPKDDYESLSNSIVIHAQGNPLALKVLGSALIGKEQNEWRSALNQLSKVQNKDIQQVLQLSYDGLSRVEKDVFLDIACFFKHAGKMYLSKDILRKIYKSNSFNIDIILSVLVDKCLVTSSNLEMHDLLQEMGKEIVRQEAKYPNQRSRLWDPEDIYEVFVGNKEAEAVESIVLDLSQIREMNLDPQVFMKIPNLKFLSFYGESNLHLSQSLEYLPNTLRYLRWDKYPIESFPSNFQPENLVVLELSNSSIKQLWKGTKEHSLVSQRKCGMMSMLINSFWRFANLTSLNLVNNRSITHLPNSRSELLEALEVLDLRGCSNLSTFPEISSNIKKMYLSGTAIKQVPSSSVELLSKLEYLTMRNCRDLESLPSNFFSKLTSLEELDLYRCSPIEKLPSSMSNLKGLGILWMNNCWKFAFNPKSFENCFLEDHHRLGSSLEGLSMLQNLNLSSCNVRELPQDLSFLSSVEYLYFCQNNFERIPPTIKQLSRLKYLNIENCKRLLSLPELPSSVSILLAQGCGSLKQIWTLEQLSLYSQLLYEFNLWNCLRLDEEECQAAYFQMIYPGSRIPEWVRYQSIGDSIQFYLPSHRFNHVLLGFAFYLCLDSAKHGYILRYDCYFGGNYHFSSDEPETFCIQKANKEHMIVFVNGRFCEWVCRHSNFEENVVFFKFHGGLKNGIKKCGVIPIYAQEDEDELCETFDFPNLGVSNGCSRLKMLPEILEPMSRTMFLYLKETAIQKLPSFIGNFNEKWTIDMSKCSELAIDLWSENCFSEDSYWGKNLILSNSNLRELPEDLSFPSFITSLDLSKNDFERIPATFKQLSRLQELNISSCKRLLSLPELPSNVCEIFADNCRSLKEIWTLKQLPLDSRMANYYFSLLNCWKLDEDECHEVVNALLRNYTRKISTIQAKFEMIYPGSRIPEWVKYRNKGDSIQIHLPSHWFNHLFLGFAFYLCLDNPLYYEIVRYDCYFGDNYHFSSDNSEGFYVKRVDKEHMVVFVTTSRFCQGVRGHGNFEENVAFFKFNDGLKNEIKKCGVIPLYAQKDEDEFYGTFDFPNLEVSKLKRSATGAGSFHCMPEKRLKIEEVE